ncbi:hypothetical protein V7S43_006045 [Phytophthora oleae]|uniref:Uncharacterized protein n=1 Tax=Phytophthora oleae TaxID=2107226 RepID=A0ABD3FSP0_9STRA
MKACGKVFSAVSPANAAITMVDVINNPLCRDRNWFAPAISANPGIAARDIFRSTMSDVLGWDYCNLSANPNLPIKYVSDNLTRDWNYQTISTRASLTDIQTYHRVKWDARMDYR